MLDVRDITVAFGGPPVLDRRVAGRRRRRGGGPARAVGQRQEHAAAGDRRAGAPAAGTVVLDGRDVTDAADPPPGHRHGLPGRAAVPPSRRGGQRRRSGCACRACRRAERDRRVGRDARPRRPRRASARGGSRTSAAARPSGWRWPARWRPRPRALLLDEPLTGLDRELHDRLAGELARILRAGHDHALIVTHDRDEAAVVADRVVTMDDRARAGPRASSWCAAADTHDLRRRVLRDGTPSDEVVFNERRRSDDACTSGSSVGTGRWSPSRRGPRRPFPGRADRAARGAAAGHGRGPRPSRAAASAASCSPAGLDRALAGGADVVWANARDTALAFYARHGFDVVGDGYVDATAGCPTTASAAWRSTDDERRISLSAASRHPGEVRHSAGVPRQREDARADRSAGRRVPPARRRAAPSGRSTRRLTGAHAAPVGRSGDVDQPRVEECRAQLTVDQAQIRVAADDLRSRRGASSPAEAARAAAAAALVATPVR